jgi:hypothetical protein
MPTITIKDDDGRVIDHYVFPARLEYALLLYMPGCPKNRGVHDLLNWLKRTLRAAS